MAAWMRVKPRHLRPRTPPETCERVCQPRPTQARNHARMGERPPSRERFDEKTRGHDTLAEKRTTQCGPIREGPHAGSGARGAKPWPPMVLSRCPHLWGGRRAMQNLQPGRSMSAPWGSRGRKHQLIRGQVPPRLGGPSSLSWKTGLAGLLAALATSGCAQLGAENAPVQVNASSPAATGPEVPTETLSESAFAVDDDTPPPTGRR